MATSRRRERELARRRYERRRQAEIERRARAKRRNTIVGAVDRHRRRHRGAADPHLHGLHRRLRQEGDGAQAGSPTSVRLGLGVADAGRTDEVREDQAEPADKGAAGRPAGRRASSPTKLVTKDIKVGHGRAAKKGDSVSVLYIGVSCSTGKVFDASYAHPPVKPFPVSPLGQASVIPGWNKGLVGIKAGGVRELIIPAALAYGAQGSAGRQASSPTTR